MSGDTPFEAKNGINANGYIVANSTGIFFANTNLVLNATSFVGTSNNTSFVGLIAAANVVSNSQMQANLANYQTTSGLAAAISAAVSPVYAPKANPTFTGLINASNTGIVSGDGVNTYSLVNQTEILVQANTTNFAFINAAGAFFQANNTSVYALYTNGYFTGTAYNATLLNGTSASGFVTAGQLASNLANYTNTASIGSAINSAFAPINNPSFTGTVTTVNTGLSIGTGSANTQINSVSVTVGSNTSNFTAINATSGLYVQANNSYGVHLYPNGYFTGTAFNATQLNGVDASGYVTPASISTLSNKTLNAPTINGGMTVNGDTSHNGNIVIANGQLYLFDNLVSPAITMVSQNSSVSSTALVFQGMNSTTNAALTNGNWIGYHNYLNHYTVTSAIQIVYATENHSNTAAGAAISFGTTPNGSTTHRTRMVIDHSGSIAVGNAVSSFNSSNYTWLNVGDANGAVISLQQNSTDTLRLYTSSDGYNALNGYTNIPTIFSTNGAERLRIAANGFIGVSVTSPNYLLDVGGDINTSSFYRLGGNPFANRIGTTSLYTALYDSAGNVGFQMGGGGSSPDTTNYYKNVAHVFQSVSGSQTFGRLSSSGLLLYSQLTFLNYGANTQTQDTNLIFGDWSGNNYQQIYWTHALQSFVITNKVSVGSKLAVGSSSFTNSVLYVAGGELNIDAYHGLTFGGSGDTLSAAAYLYSDSSGATTISANTFQVSYGKTSASYGNPWGIYMGANGNVGINTSGPTYRLDVNGSARVSSLNMNDGNITNLKNGISVGNTTTGWYGDSQNLAARFPSVSNGAFYVQDSNGFSWSITGSSVGGTKLFGNTEVTGPLKLSSFSAGTLTVDGSGNVSTNSGVGTFVTPYMYGAVGDGSADDTTALSNCLNSGKPVFLVGKFKINSAITISLSQGNSLFVQGSGQQAAQIILAGSTTAININVQYTENYIGNNSQVVLKDFSLVELTAGAGTGINTTPYGMMNIIAARPTGREFAGITADSLTMHNISFMGNGTGWNYVGLYLQDMRYINLSYINMQGCIGGTTGSGGAGNSCGICFKTTDTSGYGQQNAPTTLNFSKINITAGDFGIRFLPSGYTGSSYSMDPQGIWLRDSAIIGQASASAWFEATDQNAVEIHMLNNSFAAGGTYSVYIKDFGFLRIIGNTIINNVNSGSNYCFYYAINDSGNHNPWTAGSITNNVLIGQGSTRAIGGSVQKVSGTQLATCFVRLNSALNCGGGSIGSAYLISGTAVDAADNN